MDSENTIMQISAFDWEQLKQELGDLRQRVSKVEARNDIEVIKRDSKERTMTDEQNRAIEHILAATPQLIQDYAESGGESVYALALSPSDGGSLLASFTRWSGQYLTQTYQDNGCMHVQRVALTNTGVDEMDALCAAWIAFRCKYLPEPSQDDDLGDIDEKPF